MYCSSCGKKNHHNAHFCKNCGTKLVSDAKGRYVQNSSSVSTRTKGIIIIFGFAIIILIVFLISSRNDQSLDSSFPIYSASILDVASKFYCPCGNCKEFSLDECTCYDANGAFALKKEIGTELAKGKPRLQVIKELQEKYKSIKTEFRYLLDLQ